MLLRSTTQRLTCLVIGSLLAWHDEADPPNAITREAFTTGLTDVRQRLDSGSFELARERLLELLAEHREQPWTFAKRHEVEDILKRCAFGVDYQRPDPTDLVSGELLVYNRVTGSLRIRYDSAAMDDFIAPHKEKAEVEFGPNRVKLTLPSLTPVARSFIHPATFRGSHTIEVEGFYPKYAGDTPTVVFGMQPNGDHYGIDFGTEKPARGGWEHPQAFRVVAREREILEKADKTPAKAGEAFRIKVSVSSNEVRASLNGATLIRLRRLEEPFGRVALLGSGFDAVTLKGTAESSWIQGLIDSHREDALTKFERSFRSRDHLPPWLIAGAAREATSTSPAVDHGYGPIAARMLKVGRDGDVDGARRILESVDPADITVAGREYLRALFEFESGDARAAARHCAVACEVDSADANFWMLWVLIAAELPRDDELHQRVAASASRFPVDAKLFHTAALAMLNVGRPSLSRSILEVAAERGVRSAAIQEVHRVLVKAERGPEWTRRFHRQTDHYDVYSDLDDRICLEAASILERRFERYQRDLLPIAASDRRFQVYIFSGEAGYKAYLEDLDMTMPIHTAGVYSLTLKQLLIWNLPERDAMIGTIQHEGLHQYLDRINSPIPLWFNEGLAEYYELASDRGSWREGQVNSDHVRKLGRGAALTPIDEFVRLSPKDFYRDPSHSYAQSWALLHMLRQDDGHASLFTAMMDAINEPGNPTKRLTLLVDEAGTGALTDRLRAHLSGL